ncbi:oligosaccharide flippase family protein [Photobacterium damselae]|uniref:oligosaccharide flippase family protein n=1 Tax=Photobacterium damselae TaxID=38293 RepID=UPI001EE145C8|nr:oligosaccharide flippase family protein [Photobacterium damselae]MCG3817834.1 oligosaccharide flippase family protein [Photobacterium damselae]
MKKKIEDILYLMVYQICNFILPLLILPFLIKVLSYDAYQNLVVSQSYIFIAIAFVTFGFDIKATKELATKNITDKFNYISSIYMIRFVIFLPIVLIYILTVNSNNLLINFFSIVWVFSFFVNCNWYFYAMEDFKYVSVLNLISKIFIMPCIFFFIHSDKDVWYYFLLSAIAAIIPSIILFFKMIRDFHNVEKCTLKISNIRKDFIEVLPIFLSQVGVLLLANITTILLPIWLTSKEFTIFNLSDRIVRIISMLTAPISNAMFPYFSKMSDDKDKMFKIIRKISMLSIFCFSVLYVIYFLVGKYTLSLIFPELYLDIFKLLSFMLIIPLMVFNNNLFGNQIGLNLGGDIKFSKVVMFCGILNVLLICILAPFLSIIGVMISVIFSQLLILIGMYHIAHIKGFRYL